jgi:hypothetical protein
MVWLLFHIGFSTTVRQDTLDELGLGAPCLMAVVHVVHRHIYIRLANRCTTTGSCPFSIRKVESPCLRLWTPKRGQSSAMIPAAVAADPTAMYNFLLACSAFLASILLVP